MDRKYRRLLSLSFFFPRLLHLNLERKERGRDDHVLSAHFNWGQSFDHHFLIAIDSDIFVVAVVFDLNACKHQTLVAFAFVSLAIREAIYVRQPHFELAPFFYFFDFF